MGGACQHLVGAPRGALTHTSAQGELHWRRQQSLLTCATRMPFHSKSMQCGRKALRTSTCRGLPLCDPSHPQLHTELLQLGGYGLLVVVNNMLYSRCLRFSNLFPVP
jgi:hypothetical protein